MKYDEFEQVVDNNIREENQADIDEIIWVNQLSIEENMSVSLNSMQCYVYRNQNELIFYVLVSDRLTHGTARQFDIAQRKLMI